MITCSVCGGLNNPNNAVCEHCGSDLIDESEVIGLLYDDNDTNSSFLDSLDDDFSDSLDDDYYNNSYFDDKDDDEDY